MASNAALLNPPLDKPKLLRLAIGLLWLHLAIASIDCVWGPIVSGQYENVPIFLATFFIAGPLTALLIVFMSRGYGLVRNVYAFLLLLSLFSIRAQIEFWQSSGLTLGAIRAFSQVIAFTAVALMYSRAAQEWFKAMRGARRKSPRQ